jgi:uncharacterized integral membrane protein (TIGR00697 family)
MKKKYSFLQLVLTLVFVLALVICNIITAKQVQLPFNIVTTGGFFIFPITYILSDVFSEVYGYRWSRITCYMAFLANLIAVIIFTLVIHTPSPSYYENANAFSVVLGNTPRVLFASLIAFVMGDFVNDKIFAKLKLKHKDDHKGFGFRAILSSLFGEMTDSLIFYPLCFIGQLPIQTLAIMMMTEVIIKTSYEVVILPITRIVMKKVSKYERSVA